MIFATMANSFTPPIASATSELRRNSAPCLPQSNLKSVSTTCGRNFRFALHIQCTYPHSSFPSMIHELQSCRPAQLDVYWAKPSFPRIPRSGITVLPLYLRKSCSCLRLQEFRTNLTFCFDCLRPSLGCPVTGKQKNDFILRRCNFAVIQFLHVFVLFLREKNVVCYLINCNIIVFFVIWQAINEQRTKRRHCRKRYDDATLIQRSMCTFKDSTQSILGITTSAHIHNVFLQLRKKKIVHE